jgi:PAS domain S-box-containing protein
MGVLAISRLAAIVESSTDAMMALDQDGLIISWNPAAERMFGYPPSEAVGRHFAVITRPERVGEVSAMLERLGRGEPVEPYEDRSTRSDGASFDASVALSAIFDDRQRVFGTSAVIKDITDRTRAEATRRALEDRLQQSERLESLGQLVGGIAHDFNNLLAIILSYAEFAAESVEGTAAEADIQQVRAAAQRGARLTRQLLAFGLRAGLLDVNTVAVECQSLLSRTLTADIDVVLDLSDVPLTIHADRGQVEQVLLNLAVNARDAMPSGGTLTIGTRLVDLDEGYVELHPEVRPGRYVEICVNDTGTGMSSDVIDRALEPFFTTKSSAEGTGLGLATVHAIVLRVGGSMDISSEEGVGTTFRIFIPAADGIVATLAEARQVDHVVADGDTVLIVEDEEAILDVTTRMLLRNGFSVLKATDGEEALGLAAANDVQLLLTDSVMPLMSGAELAQLIRAVRPNVPILLMSGHDVDAIVTQLAGQRLPTIQKPFDERTLLTSVRAAIIAGADGGRYPA